LFFSPTLLPHYTTHLQYTLPSSSPHCLMPASILHFFPKLSHLYVISGCQRHARPQPCQRIGKTSPFISKQPGQHQRGKSSHDQLHDTCHGRNKAFPSPCRVKR